MILFQTTDKIQVLLSAAVATSQLQCIALYEEFDSGRKTTAINRAVATTNDTTAVDLVTAGTTARHRTVTFISIFNSDTTNRTVTLRYNANGTTYTIFKATIATGERIEYTKDSGFKVFNSQGGTKNQTSAGVVLAGSNWTTITLADDVVNNNATANTMQDVTGLSFAVTNGNAYQFVFEGCYESAIATTGSRWSVAPSGSGTLVYWNENTLAATTRTTGSYNTADMPSGSNTTSVVGLSNKFLIRGNFIADADGTIQLRFASEVSGSAITAKANMCTCDWRQIA